MMSIGSVLPVLLTAATPPLPTTTPAPPVAPAADGGPPWLAAALAGWAAVGLIVAARRGAFRGRRGGGIAGPERLADDDSAWVLLYLIGLAFVLLILTTGFAKSVVTAAARRAHAQVAPDVIDLWVGVLGEGLTTAVMAGLVWARRPDRAGLRLMGLTARQIPPALLIGPAALAVLFPLIQLAGVAVQWTYRWLRLPQAPPHEVLQLLQRDRHPAVFALAVVTAAVVAPLAEELLFRGLLQTMLGRLFSWTAGVWVPGPRTGTRPAARWAAVVVASAAFAAIHREPAFMAPIFVLSLGLGFAYERTGNLWTTVVTHGLFNAAQIALFVAFGG